MCIVSSARFPDQPLPTFLLLYPNASCALVKDNNLLNTELKNEMENGKEECFYSNVFSRV